MPTTLLSSALGTLPDRSLPVRGPDTVAVVLPMYNEVAGARRALTSLFAQTLPPDELAVSINGGTDDTYGVVSATLGDSGFVRVAAGPSERLPARLERWRRPEGGLSVVVLIYRHRTAKSEAINNLAGSALLRADRLVLVDGDTVLDPGFLAALRDNFYRLRWVRGRPVVDDYGLQCGSATSYLAPDPSPSQRFISASRTAEYAFAGIIRRGQMRAMGTGALWGGSRLFTVIGCGFAARRDVLPMPSDTLTEDHDLTLTAQSRALTIERLSPRDLDRRGLKIVVAGTSVPFSALFDAQDTVEVRRGGSARYVNEARMATEDPAHLGGYMEQILRWNVGGLQNVAKRLLPRIPRRPMSSNARFALWSNQGENLLGLALLLAITVLCGFALKHGGIAHVLTILAWWFAVDLAVLSGLTAAGFYLQRRGEGATWGRALRRAVAATVRYVPAYVLLRPAGPVSYLAAASQVLPGSLRAWWAARHRAAAEAGAGAWERPTTRSLDRRTVAAGAGLLASLTAVFAGAALLVPGAAPWQPDTVALLARTPRLELEAHDGLPLTARAPALTRVGLEPVQVSLPPGAVAAFRSGGSPQAAVRSAEGAPGAVRRVVPAPAGAVPGGTGGGQALAEVVAGASPASPVPAQPSVRPPAGSPPPAALSSYCAPASLGRADASARTLPGSPADYRPLTNFQLLMLARLAPIEPYLVEASAAYQVPPGLLLQVLINESYLDPLAVGKTGDKGLSQVTSDALTLLRGISEDPSSRFYNPGLVEGDFQVFDPDFSICAGAAKLAWARARPAARDDALAYAFYINPLTGVTRQGAVNPALVPAVDAMQNLAPLAEALGSAYAAFRRDPASVTGPAHRLLEVSAAVASGDIGLPEAYRRSRDVVATAGIDDTQVYDRVLTRLYAPQRASVPADAEAIAR